jgi:hypothetical protein
MHALSLFLRRRAAPLLLACLACLGGCGVLVKPDVVPAPPLLHSVEQADRALFDAAAERARAEAMYLQGEQVCYQKFFVNSCLDDAKEARRAVLMRLRVVEVEAGRYKREAALQQRDRELAEAEARYQAKLAREAAEAATGKAAEVAEPVPAAPAPKAEKRKMLHQQRKASHDAKEKQAAMRQQMRDAHHAQRMASMEAKRKESEQRVTKVEQRRAEQAAKQAASASAHH